MEQQMTGFQMIQALFHFPFFPCLHFLTLKDLKVQPFHHRVAGLYLILTETFHGRERRQQAKAGAASMTLNAYNYQTTNAVDILQSPKIDITNTDSVRINFDVAYSQYDASSIDSLQIIYSTDCGVTWLPTSYNKGGSILSTNGGKFVTSSFVPTATEWRNESASISTCNINTTSILIGIKSINDFGNNIYVDNFSISKLDNKLENAAVLSVNKPLGTLCTPDFTPEITIANFGFDTLKTITINYQVDNGSVSTFNYTGSLAKCNSQSVTLNSVSSSPGEHILTIFTTNPNGVDRSISPEMIQ